MDENSNVIENTIENTLVSNTTGDTIYSVAQNIHTMLSVLTFTIIVIFLFKYLSKIIKFKK